jgi:arylformamidase
MPSSYSNEELEAQYNNRLRVPEFAQRLEQWLQRSHQQQALSECRLDLAYGPGTRDRFDYYPCGDPHAALLIYIHGGYWQAGDKSQYGFVSEGPRASGFNVAILNYDLCPQVDFENIPTQLTRALIVLFGQAEELGFDPKQIILSGHSAGGHLTALLLATDFSQHDSQLPVSLFKAGISISGVFDLIPLIPTSINTALGLDENRARPLSPIHMHPVSGTPLVTAVGGDESEEFLRQSAAMSKAWSCNGLRQGQYLEIPNCNHFTIVEQLADYQGQLCASLRELKKL